MKTPKVIKPVGLNVAEDIREQGEHLGVCSCPVCGEYYASVGEVIECSKCGFQFPVDAWPRYSSGVNDGRAVKAGLAEVSGGMRRRMVNPYYRFGFENPPDGDAFKEMDFVDWRVVTEGWEPEVMRDEYSVCERCGEDKVGRRKNTTGLCVKCESETECRHRTSMLDKRCKAGVNLKEIPRNGRGVPCYYFGGCQTKCCDKWQPQTIEEIQAEDDAMDRHLQKFLIVDPLVREVKREHKGKSWSGVVECPVCCGQLHLSHAACNGHVHGHCETQDCLSWME